MLQYLVQKITTDKYQLVWTMLHTAKTQSIYI